MVKIIGPVTELQWIWNKFQNFVKFLSPIFSTSLIEAEIFLFLLKYIFKTKILVCLKKIDSWLVVTA